MKQPRHFLKSLIVTALLTAGASAMAADYRQNPFTLTYENAITQNQPGKVNIHPVRYQARPAIPTNPPTVLKTSAPQRTLSANMPEQTANASACSAFAAEAAIR
ncbi:hypothetical protein ACUHGC_11580 [Testudinibacter sp. P27/CKL/0425]